MEIMALHEADKAYMRGQFDHFSDGAVLPRAPDACGIIEGCHRNHRHAWSFCVHQPVERNRSKRVASKSRPTSAECSEEGNRTMAILPTPEPTPTPAPTPPPLPEPKPVREPDPDRLPDEAPVPNPDENDAPLKIGPKNPGI
jgi:hypothetical protein